LLGEVSFGSVKDGPTAPEWWLGGEEIWRRSLVGCRFWVRVIDKDVVLAADADVLSTSTEGSAADAQIRSLCEESQGVGDCAQQMNAQRLFTLRTAKDLNQLHRVILGTDAPADRACSPSGLVSLRRCRRLESFRRKWRFVSRPGTLRECVVSIAD
jgi:enamidase